MLNSKISKTNKRINGFATILVYYFLFKVPTNPNNVMVVQYNLSKVSQILTFYTM